MNSGGLIKIQYRSYSMRNKFTFALAGAILLGLITAISIFIAIFIGYWLVLISATIGAYVGLTVLKEEDKAKTDIPDDWYNDVGDVSREFGKTTKH